MLFRAKIVKFGSLITTDIMGNKIIVFLLLAFSLQISAQDKLDRAIQNLEKNYSQEKIHLLTDKNQYVAGDNIWFKAYVFEGYELTSISSTLFVELYDNEKKLISSKTILLTNGEASGNFTLKDDAKENVYFIRAYTPWMANFNEDYQLIKSITIYNPSSPQKLERNANSQWIAQVYPEGGTFINGLSSKFSVRLSSADTPPSDWSGYIVDTENPIVKLATFKNLDQNVATFSLTPKQGRKYQVIVEDKQSNKQTLDLPIALEKGITFHVENTKEGIKYSLKSANLSQGLENYKVVGTINHRLAYKATIKKNSTEATSTIPSAINDGNNGILQLAVFDEDYNLVAQRLIFIQPNLLKITKPDLKNISINTNQKALNSFEIPNTGNFYRYTVLVKDITDTENKDQNSILSTLWLTGDVKSKIYNPAQYFEKNSKSEALDDLLISEKWDRFDWKALMMGASPVIKYKPQNYLSFKGRVSINSRPLPNTPINLIMTFDDGGQDVNQFLTDNEGYIYIDNLYFEKILGISYYLNDGKGAVPDNLNLTFQPVVTPVLYNQALPKINYQLVTRTSNSAIAPEIKKAIDNQKNIKIINDGSTQIEEVKVRAKKRNETAQLDRELSTGMFSSINSTIFDFINENQNTNTSINILEWLQGRAAGLTFQRDQSGNNVPYIRNSQAKLYVDEMQTDANAVSSIAIGDIAMVKILKGAGLIGDAVLIYIKKGNMKSKNDNTANIAANNKVILTGYSIESEYTTTDYSKQSQNNTINDTRNVLFWNPSLSAETNQPIDVNFYNNDSAKKFRVTIISFDKNSNILYDSTTLNP